MTIWVEFFRVLCRHRQGHLMTLPYPVAVDHPGDVAQCLYMVPLPEGHPIGLTAHAEEWITGGGEA